MHVFLVTLCNVCIEYVQICISIPLSRRRGTGFFARLQVNGIEIKCIVTNNHVLPSKVSASGGEARFFYEGSSRGVPIELEPERLFHTNEVIIAHLFLYSF